MPNWEFAGFDRVEKTGTINSSSVQGNPSSVVVVFRYQGTGTQEIPDEILDVISNSPDSTRKNIALGVRAVDDTWGDWDRVPLYVETLDQSATEGSRVGEIYAEIPNLSNSTDLEIAWFYGGSGNSQQDTGTFGKNELFNSKWTNVYSMKDLTSSSVENLGSRGTGDNGTKLGGQPNEVTGIHGYAQNFIDTSSEEIEVSGFFGSPSSYTYMCWIKPSTAGGNKDFVSLGDNFHIRLNASGHVDARYRHTGSGWVLLEYNTNIKDNNWHHIAFVGTANDQRLYVDGVLRDSDTDSRSPGYDLGTNTYIGAHGISASNYFDGEMDLFMFSDQALTGDEIISMYNNQKESPTFVTRGNSPEDNILPTEIREVRKGTFTISSGSSTTNESLGITLDNRVLGFIRYSYKVDDSDGDDYNVTAELNGTTSIDFTRIGTGAEVSGVWEFVYYKKNSAVRVLRATNTMTGTTQSIGTAIPFNPDKTWPFVEWRDGGGAYGSNEAVDTSIASNGLTTNHRKSSTGVNMVNCVQLVTYHNSSVQQVSFSSSATTIDTTITAIDQSKSFAFATSSFSAGGLSEGFDCVGRVFFQNDTTVRQEKYGSPSSGTMQGYVFAIEFTDDTVIGSLKDGFTGADDDENFSISVPDKDKACVIQGTSQAVMQSSNQTGDDASHSAVKFDMTTNLNLNGQRDGSTVDCNFNVWLMYQLVSTSALTNLRGNLKSDLIGGFQ